MKLFARAYFINNCNSQSRTKTRDILNCLTPWILLAQSGYALSNFINFVAGIDKVTVRSLDQVSHNMRQLILSIFNR
uniref:Transposase and inactivated derivatives n=1 Tax=Vibrio vulnificus TaxID=672 RepID=A0A9P1JAR7_VIBVL|nr:transposase and inactivated derivatives [Vibrio vulnificus]CAL25538.1 transposase and inactivated derivatives [Vibrio vulnificus]